MPQLSKQPKRQVDTVLYEALPHCPVLKCDGRMETPSLAESIEGTGLARVQCRICQHRGFRPLEGLHVLFGTRHEYVCGYGPSTTILTIMFSETTLGFFLDEFLSPTE